MTSKKVSATWNCVLAVLLIWRGYILGRTVVDVITSPDVARELQPGSHLDLLIDELQAEILTGLEKRLAFEAWADSR